MNISDWTMTETTWSNIARNISKNENQTLSELSGTFQNSSLWNGSELLPNATTTHEEIFYTYPAPVSVILFFVYSVVFVSGIVGNCFVLAVVYRAPRMRTVTNIFIANLAFADILVIVVCLPINLVANLVTPWILGEFACKAMSYLQGVSVSASVYTLVALTADKFMAICYMRREITSKACKRIILLIWAYSLSLASPWAIFFKLLPTQEHSEYQYCSEDWPIAGGGDIYFFVANLFLCYLFPLFLITLCYFLIFLRVWKRKLPGDASCRSAAMIARRSRIKVLQMMATVCVLFALSWLPLYTVFSVIRTADFTKMDYAQVKIIQTMVPISQWLGASNSCVNPIIYAFFNQKFRRGFEAILFKRDCCGTLRYDYTANRSTYGPSVTYVPNGR